MLELAAADLAEDPAATSRSAIVHDEPFEYDVQKRVPATDKARRVLGFEATTTLDVMLDEVIPWIRRPIEDGRI